MKNVDLDEPTSFLDHVFLGCTQRECKTEWCYHWRMYKDVWNTYFSWSNWKITGVEKASRKNSSVVLRHGGTCSKMRWTILRAGKQESEAFIHSFKSLPGWPSSQAGRMKLSWRFVTSLLTNCIEILVLGTNWKTRHSVVGQQTCKGSHKITYPPRHILLKMRLSCTLLKTTKLSSRGLLKDEVQQ